MRNRTAHIEATRRYVGWIYPDLKWFTEDEAKTANEARNHLLASLAEEHILCAFKQTKRFTGGLSPGCRHCGEGMWSCIRINALCTATCFFCTQDRKINHEAAPVAAGIRFEDPGDYVEYLDSFDFKAVGFSGGEPLLVRDRLLQYLEKIKHRFGEHMYVWMYTNGDRVDEDTMQTLKNAGLDEIRFNIVHRNYDLRPIELACRHIGRVAVEVPAIPEDEETLKERLPEMQNVGVNYLNLHQLQATMHNYKSLMRRGYTFLHYPSDYPVPIFESEIAALKLLKYAVDQDITLPINYCSHIYKYRFQNAGARRRNAKLARERFETVTEAGYLRRLTIMPSKENLRKIVEGFQDKGIQEGVWLWDTSEKALSLHHSLLPYLRNIPCDVIIRYFEVSMNSQGNKRLLLSNNQSVFVEKKLVSMIRLTLKDGQFLERLFTDNTHGDKKASSENPLDIQDKMKLWESIGKWEQIESGPAEVF